MNDPYAVLGLQPGATLDEIKAAYRALAKKHHPDQNQGDPESEAKFKEISEAYSQLQNPKPQPGFNDPFDSMRTMGGFHEIHEILRRAAAQDRMRRPNLHISTTVFLTLEQIFEGCEVDINLSNIPGSPSYRVKFPRGINSTQRVRVPDGGRADNPTMPPGDLLISVRESPHDEFRRAGDDLIKPVVIDALEAILGMTLDVRQIDGTIVPVEIPAGIQFGGQVRVPNCGLYEFGTERRGDMVLVVHVEIPAELTAQHAPLIERMKEKLQNQS